MYVTAPQMADLMPDARQLLSDEPEMESTLHYQQLALLVSCLEWHWRERQDYFIGANLTVYYSHQQLRRRDFRGPDFFLVMDTTAEPRNSWVVWEEGGRYPDLIIELLSDSTAAVDRADKKSLYQNIFRTPEYFWFSPETLEFQGFRLVDKTYQAIPPDGRGHLPSQVLGLSLGVVEGRLRYFEASGALVQTPAETARQEIVHAAQERARAEQEHERAEQERARADQEHKRAEQERARAEQKHERAEQERKRAEQERKRAEEERERAENLARRLRELGIDPDQP